MKSWLSEHTLVDVAIIPELSTGPCTLAQEVEEQKRLSTQERLRQAKRRRAEQLKRWAAREREWKKAPPGGGHLHHNHSGKGPNKTNITGHASIKKMYELLYYSCTPI